MGGTAQQFLSAMRSYLGVVETPLGSNRTRVGVEFGWNGVPWCAETISLAAYHTGFGRRFWSASTDVWEANARSNREGASLFSASLMPKPGDICVWDFVRDGTPNHVSVVEAVRSDGKLITIGGNEDSRCQRAVRGKYGLRGYIRLPFSSQIVRPASSGGVSKPKVPVPGQKVEEDDMRTWLVRGPKGDVYVFDGVVLHPANDQTYRDVLRFHGTEVPRGKEWFQWSQKQIDAVPKA